MTNRKIQFREGDKVTYEGRPAVIVEYRGCFLPAIQFENGNKLCIADIKEIKPRK